MTSDEIQRRGADAARVLDEKVVKEALREIKSEIIEQWEATPARDTEGREWIWRHYKVAQKFEGLLKAYIEAGKVEGQLLKHNEPNLMERAAARVRSIVG